VSGIGHLFLVANYHISTKLYYSGETEDFSKGGPRFFSFLSGRVDRSIAHGPSGARWLKLPCPTLEPCVFRRSGAAPAMEFPPIAFDAARFSCWACPRVQRNSVPSTQMRCIIMAKRRARATIALFIPRRLAICIAQALSHDHFFDRNMLWAAS